MKREPLILPCNRSAAKIDAAPPSSPTDSGDLPIYRGCRSREGCTCLALFLIVPQARIVLTTLVLPCLAGAPDTCRRVAWQGPETSLQSRGDHELCPRLHQVPLFPKPFPCSCPGTNLVREEVRLTNQLSRQCSCSLPEVCDSLTLEGQV